MRRRSVKDRSKSTDGATAAAPVIVPARNQKLIEVEKTETGKVHLRRFFHLQSGALVLQFEPSNGLHHMGVPTTSSKERERERESERVRE